MIFPSLTLSIIKLLFLGAIIWWFFILVNRGVALLLSEKPYKNRIDNTIFYIKTASWILFIFWSADLIFRGQPLISRIFAVLLFCIIIGISWSLIRDIVSGILIKFEGTFTKTSHVKIHGEEGSVKNMGFRAMEIETDRGETLRIPYSIIDKEITIISYPIESIKSHTFELNVDKSRDFLEYQELISNTLLNNHYSSLRKDPIIKMKADSNGRYQLLVTAYILDNRYFEKVEQAIKSQFDLGTDPKQPPIISKEN